MQLSPLQSRLVASLIASIFILGIYWLLCSPNFALAAEPPLRSIPDLEPSIDLDQSFEQNGPLQLSYEPEFGLFDRSIIGRQEAEAVVILKDQPARWTMGAGESRCYVLSKSDIFGTESSQKRHANLNDAELEANLSDGEEEGGQERMRRQYDNSKTVYVSATTCLQPLLTNPDASSRAPPQLKLFYSTSKSGGCPTSSDDPDSGAWEFEQGLVKVELSVDDSPVYVNIIAPEVSKDFEGPYDFQLAMSLNTSYHQFDTSSTLLWMDSDSTAALLLTKNLTDSKSSAERIMDIGPPYELYVENNQFPAFDGIRRSLCGMEQHALISANKEGSGRSSDLVRTSLSTRGPGHHPKQQFYFEGLNKTANYTAVLVQVAGLDEIATTDSIGKRQDEKSDTRRSVVSAPINFQTLAGEIQPRQTLRNLV